MGSDGRNLSRSCLYLLLMISDYQAPIYSQVLDSLMSRVVETSACSRSFLGHDLLITTCKHRLYQTIGTLVAHQHHACQHLPAVTTQTSQLQDLLLQPDTDLTLLVSHSLAASSPLLSPNGTLLAAVASWLTINGFVQSSSQSKTTIS